MICRVREWTPSHPMRRSPRAAVPSWKVATTLPVLVVSMLSGLENLGLKACSFEKQCHGGTGDPASNNQSFFLLFIHCTLLCWYPLVPISFLVRNVICLLMLHLLKAMPGCSAHSSVARAGVNPQ